MKKRLACFIPIQRIVCQFFIINFFERLSLRSGHRGRGRSQLFGLFLGFFLFLGWRVKFCQHGSFFSGWRLWWFNLKNINWIFYFLFKFFRLAYFKILFYVRFFYDLNIVRACGRILTVLRCSHACFVAAASAR